MTQSFEEFTPEQEALLGNFVTNTKGSIFALYNLPEVVKGALFSRYSRSTLGLRTLLLREFLSNKEESGVVGGNAPTATVAEQLEAIKKAQKFYDRILDGYGDDSIGELGGPISLLRTSRCWPQRPSRIAVSVAPLWKNQRATSTSTKRFKASTFSIAKLS